MSNRRRASRKPPPEAMACAAAYLCGHCTGRARPRRKPDHLGVWHIDVAHDASCPALAGTVPLTGAGLRALDAMVKATGTNCIYIPLAAEGGLTARHSQRACTVRTSGYSEHVSEPAAEMPISDAREHLADVVNRAVYGGEATYLTRRGRRLALVVSAAQLEADQARARQQAIVETHRQLWERFKDADDATRTMVRDLIDQSVELAEDHADVAVLRASLDDRESGAEPEPWEQVKAELGL